MARPKEPLIEKDQVIDVATQMLETRSPSELTLRALAARLNVNSASLYHHFRNKDEILAAVVRKALREVSLAPVGNDWRAWVCENAVSYRRLLIRRPFLLALTASGIRPQTVVYAVTDTLLVEAGIGEDLRPEVMATLESYVIGSALVAVSPIKDGHAMASLQLDHEALLRDSILQLLVAVVDQARKAERTQKRNARAPQPD